MFVPICTNFFIIAKVPQTLINQRFEGLSERGDNQI